MRTIVGVFQILAGIAIYGLGIAALVSWLVFCFGTVIIGVALLIFVPWVLLAPLAICTPGTALIMLGIDKLANNQEDSAF